MSRVLCRTGCGDVGDPELEFLCVDCHGDRADALRERERQTFISAKKKEELISTLPPGAALPPSTRRGPPSINHQQALQEFLNRTREKDASVIARENQFLARELEVRETSKAQLRKYMIATDEGEPVDPKEWSRYKYGAPRDVPRHDIDQATELAAQITLFCAWRARTMRSRVEMRRQISLAAEMERAKHQSPSARLLSAASSPRKKATSKSAAVVKRESLAAALQGLVPKMAKEAQKAKAAVKRASLLAPTKPAVDTAPPAT